MEMLISRDWLRRKIEATPDIECDAGMPAAALESLGMFLPPELQEPSDKVVRLTQAFGVLIRQLRRRDGLSISALATKARVDEVELQHIECDEEFRPRPRTVHQLASHFKLPERAMMKLSGATITHDRHFEEEAHRFAAKSAGLSTLKRDELKILKSYIRYLAKSETS